MKEGIFFAKEFERNGVIFYLEKGMRAENIITKKLFYTLAKQEIEHLEAIENFIISGRYDTYRDNVKEVEFEIKKFFESLEEKDRLEKQLEVYSVALNMEKQGYSQYERFYNEAVDEKEKKFFKFLMGEERKHIEALVNVYSYISETDDWFHKEESRVWNWMNL